MAYDYAHPNGGNNGQITRITDNVDNGRTIDFTYDALHRLKTAVSVGSAAYPKWGLEWTYDRYGNRLSQAQTHGNPPHHAAAVDPLTNRISDTGYAYDAAGNMTADGLNQLTYDAENRIVRANSSEPTYVYDGGSLRVKKCSPNCTNPTTTTVYIFSGTKVIAEYVNGSLSREYVYLGGQLIATHEGGNVKYHHADHLSIRVTTDSAGSVVGQRGHYPFGDAQMWYETGGTDKWKFTTYERDDSLNDYAIFRFYANRLGRFNSPDPVAGTIRNPQSLNRYGYVLNDPINSVDPLGLCEIDVAVAMVCSRMNGRLVGCSVTWYVIKSGCEGGGGSPTAGGGGTGGQGGGGYRPGAAYLRWAKEIVDKEDCAEFLQNTAVKAKEIELGPLNEAEKQHIRDQVSPESLKSALDQGPYLSRFGRKNPKQKGSHTTLATYDGENIILWDPFFKQEFGVQHAQALIHEVVHKVLYSVPDTALGQAATGKPFSKEEESEASNAFHKKLQEKCN